MVTLNLFTRDVDWFKREYEYGYTEAIRKAIRAYIKYKEELHEYDQ